MSEELYRMAMDEAPRFSGHRFVNDTDETLHAKFRQVGRLVADRLNGLSAEERADWLAIQYPGGLDAGKALMIHVLHDKSVAPSRALRSTCKEMFGAERITGERQKRKEEEP